MLVLLIDDSPIVYSNHEVNSAEENFNPEVSSLPIGQDCQEIGGALDSWARPRWEELQVILDKSQGGDSYSLLTRGSLFRRDASRGVSTLDEGSPL